MKKHLKISSLLVAVVVLAASCSSTNKTLKTQSIKKDSIKLSAKTVSTADTVLSSPPPPPPPQAPQASPVGPTHPPGKN